MYRKQVATNIPRHGRSARTSLGHALSYTIACTSTYRNVPWYFRRGGWLILAQYRVTHVPLSMRGRGKPQEATYKVLGVCGVCGTVILSAVAVIRRLSVCGRMHGTSAKAPALRGTTSAGKWHGAYLLQRPQTCHHPCNHLHGKHQCPRISANRISRCLARPSHSDRI